MTNGINEITNGIEYENTLVNIENRLELVPGFKFLPKEEISDMSTKDNEEIYLERERYLINTDDLLEEFLNKDKIK